MLFAVDYWTGEEPFSFARLLLRDRLLSQPTGVSSARSFGSTSLSPDARFAAYSYGYWVKMYGNYYCAAMRDLATDERWSRCDDGSSASVSHDGRFVAYCHRYVPTWHGGGAPARSSSTEDPTEAFIYDRQENTTAEISAGIGGAAPNGDSCDTRISGDGRYVVFTSSASNLVAGDTNDSGDVFLYARLTGVLTRVSLASDGTQANGSSFRAAISSDGRHIAFASCATNLVAGDTNGVCDVFPHDRVTHVTTRVSVASDGAQANGANSEASISADGGTIAFSSEASDLVADDTNGVRDIFVAGPELSPGPDLTVSSIAVTPNPCTAGVETTLTVVIGSEGTEAADACEVQVWRHHPEEPTSGNQPNVVVRTDPLSPGETQTFTDTFTPHSLGDRIARALVDADDEVEEMNESNNVGSLAYSIDPTNADLTFQSLAVGPDPVNLGNEAMITAAITNQGTDPSTECLLQLWRHRTGPPVIGTTGDFTHTVGALAPGAMQTFTSRFFPHFQNYRTAWGLVDSRNVVAEQDESNSKASHQCKIDPGDTPDLLCWPGAIPDPVTLGNAITLEVRVRNEGTVAAGAFTLAAWRHRPVAPIVGSPPDVTWPFSGLAVGTMESRSTTFTPAYPGPRIAWALADSTNAVIENNEGNNVSYDNYAIVTGNEPDLIPTVTVTPDPTTVGATTTLSVTVDNAGSTAAGPFTLAGWRHRASAPGLATPPQLSWPMAGLGLVATVTVTDTFTPNYAGSRTAWAFADQTQAILETNEANNIPSDAYTINAASGNGALAVTAASAEPTRGGRVAISYSLSAPADVEVCIRNIAGRLVARLHAGEREAGASTETWTGLGNGGARVPAGVYLCEIVARNEGGHSARAIASARVAR